MVLTLGVFCCLFWLWKDHLRRSYILLKHFRHICKKKFFFSKTSNDWLIPKSGSAVLSHLPSATCSLFFAFCDVTSMFLLSLCPLLFSFIKSSYAATPYNSVIPGFLIDPIHVHGLNYLLYILMTQINILPFILIPECQKYLF